MPSVEPEILTRKDTEAGTWEVEVCAPKRGEAWTNIIGRVISVPVDDTERSRTIRAHEMMHAKVTPADDWKAWIDRGIASEEALRACEELRVNFLCQMAGFPMDKHLTDGGETADGERIVALNDWRNAVYFAIATAGTASAKPFLNGVRRQNREWGKHLLSIQKRALKTIKKIAKQNRDLVASTAKHHQTGLHPLGFKTTEGLAEWVDRLAGEPPPPEEPEAEETGAGGEGDTVGHEHSDVDAKRRSFTEKLSKIEPDDMVYSTNIPEWGELRIGKVPLNTVSSGHMGRKRVATNVGRNPRRIGRMITDPQKRVFDRKVRGLGGIVVLDVSGSMSWTREEIRSIVENSNGATVLAYSYSTAEVDNAWILAENGKVFTEDFDMSCGNGVDFPALEWATKRRKGNEPIVWVTDGGVTGVNDGYSDMLARQCMRHVRQHGIIVYETLAEAVTAFKKMSNGQKVYSKLPWLLRESEKR